MNLEPRSTGLVPPLQLAWRRDIQLSSAVAGNQSLYGITPSGSLVALAGDTGNQRWAAKETYLPHRLVRQGMRLFAYRAGEGFGYLDDAGTSVTETLALSFGASVDVNLSLPVIDGEMVYLAVNSVLYAWHQKTGLHSGTLLGDVQPYSVGLVEPGQLITVDGRGVPTRYLLKSDGLEVVWTGVPNGVDAGQTERPFAVMGSQLIIGVGLETVAYNLNNGALLWRSAVPSAALAPGNNGLIYSLSYGATLRSIVSADGRIVWTRQYLYDVTLQTTFGLACTEDYVFAGGALRLNPDGALQMAIRRVDGGFVWLSRAAKASWAAGLPLVDGDQLYVYGSSHCGAYRNLVRGANVRADMITVTPRPLRGQQSGFGMGSVSFDLPAAATISIATYREGGGQGSRLVSDASYGAGPHSVTWNVAGAGGFSDANQFGYMLVDVAEAPGVTYTQGLLLPVNTFPDILSHWARSNIEIMVFNKYVGGYPDQTFRPDNLVNRAESATIIAKTLNADRPSDGFRTRFTDIAGHWARNYILALEERGIIGGFQEPDGTFTFRPELNMTRAQEARILVRAYSIPSPPADFKTRFADISGHWAEADIKTLEAAGYVNGFQEPDGSFTYRPDQNLTRAELCTVVVRIRRLSR